MRQQEAKTEAGRGKERERERRMQQEYSGVKDHEARGRVGTVMTAEQSQPMHCKRPILLNDGGGEKDSVY